MKKCGNSAEAHGGPPELVEREVGDILFTVVNLARHLDVDAEHALRTTAREFVRRYGLMEEEARRRGMNLASIPLAEKEELWQKAKQQNDKEEPELDFMTYSRERRAFRGAA